MRTLGNAIARGQLAQAWLLTGVRGVGKTSTARIIAKALNCVGPDGTGGPTISPCGVCEPCVAIAAGRHMDVIEMDAGVEHRHRRRPRDHRGGALRRRHARATRSTSSTKSTCCRRRRSTAC